MILLWLGILGIAGLLIKVLSQFCLHYEIYHSGHEISGLLQGYQNPKHFHFRRVDVVNPVVLYEFDGTEYKVPVLNMVLKNDFSFYHKEFTRIKIKISTSDHGKAVLHNKPYKAFYITTIAIMLFMIALGVWSSLY